MGRCLSIVLEIGGPSCTTSAYTLRHCHLRQRAASFSYVRRHALAAIRRSLCGTKARKAAVSGFTSTQSGRRAARKLLPDAGERQVEAGSTADAAANLAPEHSWQTARKGDDDGVRRTRGLRFCRIAPIFDGTEVMLPLAWGDRSLRQHCPVPQSRRFT